MIINFSITNFGPIKDKQTLSFEADKSTHLEDNYVIEKNGVRLLKVALIYGTNASGKTTILKALDFLRELVLEPKEKKNDVLDFEPFLFDTKTPTSNSLLSIEFLQNNIKYYYEVEFNKKAILREQLDFYSPRKANVFKRTTNLGHQFTEIEFGGKIEVDKTFHKILEANTLWNNIVLGGFTKTNIDINELKEVTEWFQSYLSPVILPNSNLKLFITSLLYESKISKKDVINILNRADFNITDIIIEKNEEDIPSSLMEFLETQTAQEELDKLKSQGKITSLDLQFEHTVNSTSYNLPFNLESQGTKRYYGFAGLLSLLIDKSVAFSIDELETSLHPDLYRHFILLFLQNNEKSQLIVTTHNREILNEKDIFRDDAVWITDKSDTDCATKLYSLADFDTSVIRDTTNRFNAYKSGKLGGIPNLGDIYITK